MRASARVAKAPNDATHAGGAAAGATSFWQSADGPGKRSTDYFAD
jgi:hypothetical protein